MNSKKAIQNMTSILQNLLEQTKYFSLLTLVLKTHSFILIRYMLSQSIQIEEILSKCLKAKIFCVLLCALSKRRQEKESKVLKEFYCY